MLPDGVQLIFQLRFLGSSRDEGLDFIQLTGIARLESTRVVKDKTVGRGIHDFVLNVVFPTLNDIPSSRNVEGNRYLRYEPHWQVSDLSQSSQNDEFVPIGRK